MKVALVTQGYQVVGGVSAVARWLRDGLLRAGYDVDVHDLAMSSFDPRSRRLRAPGTWLRGPVARPGVDPGVWLWGANWVELEPFRYSPRPALTRALNTYDIIQVVTGSPALADAVGDARPPKVLQMATTLRTERTARLQGMSDAKRLLQRAVLPVLYRQEMRGLRAVDHVLVENRAIYDWVRAQGQLCVTLTPPGIDVDTFIPAGEWNADAPVIAFGRLNDVRKDWPTAVRAYARFVQVTGRSNRLVVAGAGSPTADLLEEIDRTGLSERISLVGEVPAADLPGLLAGGSVFLQSSLEEGLGLAGLEAMACGLPVVATRTAGSAEYVRDGVNGYLVDVGRGSAHALSVRLARVFSGQGPAMSRQAVDTCRGEYSATVALRAFQDVYKDLASRRTVR